METVTLFIDCPECKKTFPVTVPRIGYIAWKAGVLIQDAMPDVPRETREMLITGIDPECWIKVAGEE